ncbi:MAG: hypothetical protein GWO16_01880 [Gammaproteobacteria bacterium]|nr:hypothetical protein [Gammaproteobacteria bacterium]NIR28465.1 hypothetical protein [Gammaproteobacteria bacterium]NIR96911.1 hypothetical protein [Gammaproteobacteria bacterium]NIT62612.1 hypothetical protein [Gammaproteobacteria bacterium]NIV19569.1 hypothetical protein [Gammaproteobacteria bacterium]
MSERTEIPRREWPVFCDGFTRQHHGWRVSLELADTAELERAGGGVVHRLAHDLTFQGITEERDQGEAALSITVRDGARHVTHWVRVPAHLFSEIEPNGAHRGLRIDAAGGESVLIRFRAPARPETLDGIAAAER